MLAEVVAVQQMLGHAGACRVERRGVVGHARYCLQNNGSVHGIRRSDSPAKGRVSCDQHRRDRERVEVFEAASDGVAGVEDIIAADLLCSQLLGDGDRPVEVVSVGGAVCGNLAAGLRPRGGKF